MLPNPYSPHKKPRYVAGRRSKFEIGAGSHAESVPLHVSGHPMTRRPWNPG